MNDCGTFRCTLEVGTQIRVVGYIFSFSSGTHCFLVRVMATGLCPNAEVSRI